MVRMISSGEVGQAGDASFYELLVHEGDYLQVIAHQVTAEGASQSSCLLLAVETPTELEAGRIIPNDILHQLAAGEALWFYHGTVTRFAMAVAAGGADLQEAEEVRVLTVTTEHHAIQLGLDSAPGISREIWNRPIVYHRVERLN